MLNPLIGEGTRKMKRVWVTMDRAKKEMVRSTLCSEIRKRAKVAWPNVLLSPLGHPVIGFCAFWLTKMDPFIS